MNDQLIETINALFLKKRNTIYEVRIVNDEYHDRINIFFQHYRIGYATVSQQIARFEGSERGKMPELARQITQQTKVSVELVSFD